MNLRIVRRQLGLLFVVLSGLILVIALFAGLRWGLGDDSERPACLALLSSGLGGAVLGSAMWWLDRKDVALNRIGRREAILLVGASWFFGAGVAAAPYRLWAFLAEATVAESPHEFHSYVDCYFESMSGLTTTGATVLTQIGTLPDSLLLWRSLTHWLGGLGIVVLFVAVLPLLGVGGRRLFKTESPGPTPEGVRPRVQEAARVLWFIYLGLTVVEILALRICGMTWFESVCHTFATLATGGFSTEDASLAAFPSSAIHAVIIVFMLLAGINFGLYYRMIQGNWRSALKDVEFRTYLMLIGIGTVIIATAELIRQSRLAEGAEAGLITVRDSLFQVVSIQTTTGFCTADFDGWSFISKATLLGLMFVGGSAGSTGGGIKVIRILVAFKVAASELEHVFRPHVVRTVKIGGRPVDSDLKLSTMVYVLGILCIFALGACVLMLTESSRGIDITSAATASMATLNNIGPGLARVGATQNYTWFSDLGKGVMCVLMAFGRLELFTVAVLFTPRFWRGN